MFLKNRNIRSKIKRSKVTDYAVLRRGFLYVETYSTVRNLIYQQTKDVCQFIAYCVTEFEIIFYGCVTEFETYFAV